MPMHEKIGILGAGSWGTALALQAAKSHCEVLLWGRDAELMQELARDRRNSRYLPAIDFPGNLRITSSLHEVAEFSDVLLIVVPSHAFRETLVRLKACTDEPVKIAWATKGFIPDNGSLLHYLVAEIFAPTTPVAVLSGPTFATEVAQGLPTAVTLAASDAAFAGQLTQILHSECFRIYTSSDMAGVEVGGAVKNVLAIAAGIADGLGFGANTRAALITRGLTEMMRLGVKLGGLQETFMGLAGLGDLILTCTDNQSRNRRLGLALGQGINKTEAIAAIGQEIEGIPAAKETFLLAQKSAIEMPITEQTYRVLYEHLDPRAAVHALLNRELKAETVFENQTHPIDY